MLVPLNSKNEKRMVLLYCKGNTGCSHVRLRYYADYLNAIDSGIDFITMNYPTYTFDPAILSKCNAIVFEKANTRNEIEVLRKYKALQERYGYSMVYELDDLLFRSELSDPPQHIPDYNIASLGTENIPLEALERQDKVIGECMLLCDVVSSSTEYLSKVIRDKYKHPNVKTILNTVPRYLWNCPRKEHITEDIKKPVVLYTGSPCHYMNPRPDVAPNEEYPRGAKGTSGKPGDWNTVFKEWIFKSVIEDRIELVIAGAMPYFFKPIENKIRFIEWANSMHYPRRIMDVHADFQIAPLVDNEFNRCKSAIKYYESAITGSVLIGSVFSSNDYSPYSVLDWRCQVKDNATVDSMDAMLKNLCRKEVYNELLDKQYEMLDKGGHILESDQAIDDFMTICDRNTKTLDTI